MHACRSTLEDPTEAGAARDVDELSARLASRLDAVIRPIEGGIRTVASQLEEVDPPPDQHPARIRGILAAWPDVYGSTIALEVSPEGTTRKPFAPYLYRRGDSISYSDLALDSYSYDTLPWYRRAADGGEPLWSLPYFDEGGGNTWMITYSVPFYRRLADKRRVLAGVVTADLALDGMQRVAANVSTGPIGMGWLSSPPDTQSFMTPIGATVSRLRDFDSTLQPEELRGIAERMLADKKAFLPLPSASTSAPSYLAVRNLETLDWRLILLIPRAQLLAEARDLLNRQALLGVTGLLVLVVAISIVAAGISRPVHALAVAVGKTSAEDPDFQLPERPRRDEIGILEDALRRMRDSLRKHIELRAQSLAEQARAENELQIAASIQQSMLPRDSKSLPADVTIAAALLPARQVGGDLYDYFPVSDGNLLFAIGDVSDKGVPAALFMARLSAQLRILGAGGELPHKLVAGINRRLTEGNDACMFVTLGCGLLNLHTGSIRYVSAGHEPPLVLHPDGTVRLLPTENGGALGIDAEVDYLPTDAYLAPGDTLVLFTDGVTEAEAKDGSLFGLDRLIALMREAPDSEPERLVQQIVGTMTADTSDFHSTDDLTVLAISWTPSGVSVRSEGPTCWRIEPEVSADGILQAQLWLRAILAARNFAGSIVGDVELIAEELLTNIVRANEGRELHISIDCTPAVEGIALTVSDDGLPFDPLARAAPDLDADIAEREIGGLGVAIVRQLAERCRYSQIDGRNVLEVFLKSPVQ